MENLNPQPLILHLYQISHLLVKKNLQISKAKAYILLISKKSGRL